MNLMVVDDEERFVLTIQKALSRKGYRTVTATSGFEALEILEKESVHIIILDVKMPGMDGIATLKAVKSCYPRIDVIMLTGHATMESALEGLQSGAADYLMKPVDIDELIQKAEEAYGKRRALEEKKRIAPFSLNGNPPPS